MCEQQHQPTGGTNQHRASNAYALIHRNMESLYKKSAKPSQPVAPVKIKREHPSPYRKRITHPHGARAKLLQASFGACEDITNTPTDKNSNSIIEIISLPEPRPSKKPKASDRLVGCCTCGPTSKCSNRKCACRRHQHLCTICTSKCCKNSNDSEYVITKKEDSKETAPTTPTTPTPPTPSPLTQPSITSAIDEACAVPNEEDSATNDSDCCDGPTQTLPSQDGDLPNCKPTPMDAKIASAFDGQCLRDNDGTHLDGGVVDDKLWQDRYHRLIMHPLNIHDLLSGPAGRSFIKSLCAEINGVISRSWNFERVLCFISTILQQSPDIKSTPSIRNRIKSRLQDWNDNKHNILVSSAVLCAEALMKRKWKQLSAEERAKIFTSLLNRGKIKEAIRFICDRETGGACVPDDIDEKSGNFIKETLKSKHLAARDVDLKDAPHFEECPEFQDLVADTSIVEKVAKKLSGSNGPTGIDANTMASWLLRCGGHSAELCKAIAHLTEWLANEFPPWVACRSHDRLA